MDMAIFHFLFRGEARSFSDLLFVFGGSILAVVLEVLGVLQVGVGGRNKFLFL